MQLKENKTEVRIINECIVFCGLKFVIHLHMQKRNPPISQGGGSLEKFGNYWSKAISTCHLTQCADYWLQGL